MPGIRPKGLKLVLKRFRCLLIPNGAKNRLRSLLYTRSKIPFLLFSNSGTEQYAFFDTESCNKADCHIGPCG